MSIFVGLEAFRINRSKGEQSEPVALLTGEALEFCSTLIILLQ